MSQKTTILSALFCGMLLGAAVVQRTLIHQARTEHQQLQTAAQGASAVVPPNAVEETEETRAAKHELVRLRNEVHQLRAQKPDLDRLRSENDRLASRIIEVSKRHLPPTEEQGFALRQNWAPSGFAFPEATAMTFFWALREQDYQSALACITEQEIRQSKFIDKETQTLRPDVAEDLVRLAKVQGLRIAALQTNSPGGVRLDLQSNPDGPTITLRLSRMGEEWKIDGF